MHKDTETLLELVLAAVMVPDNDALVLATTLRNTAADAPAISVVHALLAADRVIVETFNGNAPARVDAQLARAMALTVAAATDDLSRTRDASPIVLAEVLL